ncbi:MAG: histone deacetylase family protein [Bosea sp. (in: a-proteobacteria)]|uniref:histone deacetylase family protein n=1 Tax=Bosea sp. (in: a-proteobacteria) TaxID=1871050 RepID=UPI0027343E8B|nr:histone deacetylase family protein [Bosea sp. (in: a-proteobacteria)]MDP3254388.1 histone deacetylase family protein [Bosea sp. (in: a-proteobacteria)]MDP3319140.1 histone deacetylase family protein [Bosea sp. (in: a-proteobacteria)]
MRAFYHPDQSMHDPQQYLRFGAVVAPKDLPERTARLLAALERHGIAPERPAAHGKGPVLAIHDAGFVHFLETAWERWQDLPAERGPEVWPSTFPYWSGRPEEAVRPPCRPTGFIGQLGWYLGDMSVPIGEHCWRSTLLSAETAVTAADAVIAGERAVYSLCRPSGHHARADRASGFCYLNNTAIAAQRLRSTFKKVAILDVDAHHGDGTQQIFYRRDDVLTISVHADPSNYYPFYTGYEDERGNGPGEGFNLNLPLPHGSGGAAMAAAVDKAGEAIKAFGADVVIVALGYDAHKDDPIGVLKLDAADFGTIASKVKGFGLPTLVVQEGGYAIEAIGDCLDAFLGGFK